LSALAPQFTPKLTALKTLPVAAGGFLRIMECLRVKHRDDKWTLKLDEWK
jgi:hypothetical protein